MACITERLFDEPAQSQGPDVLRIAAAAVHLAQRQPLRTISAAGSHPRDARDALRRLLRLGLFGHRAAFLGLNHWAKTGPHRLRQHLHAGRATPCHQYALTPICKCTRVTSGVIRCPYSKILFAP